MNNKLKIVEFEVNFIYGFLTKPFSSDSEFKKVVDIKKTIFNKYNKKVQFLENYNTSNKHLIRNGWNTFYNLNSTNNGLIQEIPIGILNNNKKSQFCDFINFKRIKPTEKWENSSSVIKSRLYKTISIRKDGVGTLTLKFKFPKQKSKDYCTGDILRSLLLVPRTLYGNGDEITQVNEKLELPDKLQRKIGIENWNSFSFPYKLYLKTLTEELHELNIWEFNPTLQTSFSESHTTEFQYQEEICPSTDTQIPYFFVTSKINNEQYFESIFDNSENRHELLKELAGILGRWLNEHNLEYVSRDYWDENETLKSKFMNSLAYTIYSGMVTLMLYPDLSCEKEEKYNLMLKPISITHETILRYLEFSRLRWHNAVFLNKILDKLIFNIVNEDSAAFILTLYEQLLTINNKIALHLENPSFYLWDASLGSKISAFIDQNIIDDIEKDIIKKSSQSQIIFDNKISYIKNLSFIKKYLNQSDNA